MFVVDTNILIYGTNEDAPEFGVCRRLLEAWCGQPGIRHVTWGILYDFLRITTHPRVLEHPWTVGDAWDFVEKLLAAPGLSVLTETELHAQIAGQFFRQHRLTSGNLIFDAHTAILTAELGMTKIYTRDTDFHKFSTVKVVDPLR